MNPYFPTLLLFSMLGSSVFAAPPVAGGSGSAPPGIQVVSNSAPLVGMQYEFVETTKRDPVQWRLLVDRKRQQYESQVKERVMTREEADARLKAIEASPMRDERRGKLTIALGEGRIWASEEILGKPMAWVRIEDGLAVSQSWSGGEGWNLDSRGEPYSLANTEIPVLPLQLPSVHAFADLQLDGESGTARMFAVSTNTDQYQSGKIRFDGSRLSEAEIPGIERTRYSDYLVGTLALPRRIDFERNYDSSGQPQIVRTYVGHALAHPRIPTLDELATAKGVEVVDRRSDPPRQFVYKPATSGIREQAESGRPMTTMQALPNAPSSPIPFSTWLLGGSLLLLAGTAIARIVVARRDGADRLNKA